MERSKQIFGNAIGQRDYRKAQKSKASFARKFGKNASKSFNLHFSDNSVLTPAMNVRNVSLTSEASEPLPENPLIVGNIRMGFGHYRISMAIASAAHALGYTPCWFDISSFDDTVCSRIIRSQNDLYSLGSRLSQRSKIFNALVWEPMNSEGFRKLSYNAADQKNAELMAEVFSQLPKDVPFVGTHAWPAQAAVHAGLTSVVNAIPDNWQMALHLSEGAKHTVQSPSAYLGYRTLRGMDGKKQLKPMPANSIYYTGHYIDHEIVSNIEHDCALRVERAKQGGARRYLLSVGGAGAQKGYFIAIIKSLLPDIEAGKAVLFVNFGDHYKLKKQIVRAVPALKNATDFSDNYADAAQFALSAIEGEAKGIYTFCDSDIFSAVYITNLLMRACDVLITKPSELAFYPVPKLLVKRVGGHEAWGAIRSAEIGDGTFECERLEEILAMTRLMQEDASIIEQMCRCIADMNKAGIYNGAYRVVRLAAGLDMD